MFYNKSVYDLNFAVYLSVYNKNIKEQMDNENAVKYNQFPHNIARSTVVNKDYDNAEKSVKNKSIKNYDMNLEQSVPVKNKSIKNNDVNLEQSVPVKTDQNYSIPVRRSN